MNNVHPESVNLLEQLSAQLAELNRRLEAQALEINRAREEAAHANARAMELEQFANHANHSVSPAHHALPAHPAPREPKPAKPPFFHGDRKNTQDFLTAVNLTFTMNPSTYATDGSKIGFMASYFRDAPMKWYSSLLANRPGEETNPLLANFQHFLAEFKKLFDDPNIQSSAERRLEMMRQRNRPATALVAEFRQYACLVDWNDAALKKTFYHALSEDVKDELARVDRPDTLAELYDLAIRIDNRLFERRSEKGRRPVSHGGSYSQPALPRQDTPRSLPLTLPTPAPPAIDYMDVDSVRRRPDPKKTLSDDAKRERIANNLCLYCGERGHRVATCPNRRPSSTISTISTISIENPQFFVNINILVPRLGKRTLVALVDTGAACTLMSADAAYRLKLHQFKKPTPVHLRVVDGRCVSAGAVEFETGDLSFDIPGCRGKMNASILDKINYDLILGIDWLTKFEPTFDWKRRILTFPLSTPSLAPSATLSTPAPVSFPPASLASSSSCDSLSTPVVSQCIRASDSPTAAVSPLMTSDTGPSSPVTDDTRTSSAPDHPRSAPRHLDHASTPETITDMIAARTPCYDAVWVEMAHRCNKPAHSNRICDILSPVTFLAFLFHAPVHQPCNLAILACLAFLVFISASFTDTLDLVLPQLSYVRHVASPLSNPLPVHGRFPIQPPVFANHSSRHGPCDHNLPTTRSQIVKRRFKKVIMS